ncbi:MAG: site-specific integrase [bacterium]
MACIVKRRGRYVIDFYDNQGRRRWVTMPAKSTKKKTQDKLREIEDQLARGIYLPAKKIPTFKEVAEDWLQFKKPNLRETSYALWAGYVKNHYAAVKDLRVDRIGSVTVEKFISAHQTAGMNVVTLRKILMVFGQIMQYAVRHKLIDHNPVRDAEKPRSPGREGRTWKMLAPAEIQKLLAAEPDMKYRTIYHLAIMTGARQGELLALKWTDLDFESGQLSIQRSTKLGKFFAPKTEASVRRIDLGPSLLTELKKWKLACPKCKLDLMFPNEAGRPMEHNNLMERHFKPALTKACLPGVRFHDLRHLNASMRLEQGENIKYIQSQLGHANPTITLNTYSHLMKARDPEAARRLEEAVFSATGSKPVAESQSENEKGVTL